MSKDIVKSETVGSKAVSRPITNKEIGQPFQITSSTFIQDVKRTELAMPRRFYTYESMLQDDAVFNSVDVTNLLVLLAMANGKFVPSENKSRVSEELAKFLNYNIHNMSYGTWMETVNNLTTDIVNGFSLTNIVTEKRNHGKYRGMRVLKKLAPRDPKSLYGWVWDNNYREVVGFMQKPNIIKNRVKGFGEYNNALTATNYTTYQNGSYPYTPISAAIHTKYNPTMNNPQGDSPLNHCFDAFLEKKLVEKYEVVGVSKDLGGALILRVPSDLIIRASQPDVYPDEAREYEELQKDAALLHAGESTYIVLASDVDPSTKSYDYDISFKGIDGGGKQYKTSDIIDQKRKSIYNVFGTGFLLLGQSSVGSYALSSSQTTTHGMYVQRNIMWKCDAINNQLIPAILMANNLKIDWEDMPRFEPKDPDEMSVDDLSKAIQRMKSVGGLTPEALKTLYLKAGLPTEGIDELTFDDGDTSRSGESNGTSGTGNTQSGGAASATNSENGGVSKNLILDGDTIIDSKTGAEIIYEQN